MKDYNISFGDVVDARVLTAAAKLNITRSQLLQMAITLLCVVVENDADISLEYNGVKQNVLYK